ncbi:hypothetical protein V8E54_010770 [Elaphomyces granulatus]
MASETAATGLAGLHTQPMLSLLEPDDLPPFPPATTSIAGYVVFADLVQNEVLMTINGQVIDNFWSGVPDLQEWMVRIVLNELNIAIHAWVDSPDQYSQRLENSGRILRLFGMLERLGMHAEIPEVTWDVRRHAAPLQQVENQGRDTVLSDADGSEVSDDSEDDASNIDNAATDEDRLVGPDEDVDDKLKEDLNTFESGELWNVRKTPVATEPIETAAIAAKSGRLTRIGRRQVTQRRLINCFVSTSPIIVGNWRPERKSRKIGIRDTDAGAGELSGTAKMK